MRVFVVQHEHEVHGCDEVKFIGVYSTEEQARAVDRRCRTEKHAKMVVMAAGGGATRVVDLHPGEILPRIC